MSTLTPIRVGAAKAALNQYLDEAGVTAPADRYAALNRQIAVTWLRQLQSAGLADGLDVFDIIAGKDAMIADLIWEMPTSGGASDVALLALRPSPLALLPTPITAAGGQ